METLDAAPSAYHAPGMTPTIPDYVTPEYLSSLVLLEGPGSGTPGQRCAMQEIRAWLGLDASSDAIPPCVCPVLGRLIVHLQDAREDWRAALVPLLPRLVGSAGDEEVTRRRAYRCADWVCRVAAPAALEAAGLTDSAARLRRLAPVTDRASARAAEEASGAAAAEAVYAAREGAVSAAVARARMDGPADPIALVRALLGEWR